MLLCSSWKMKYFNGSKTREITWNDPFAILRFPLSKLVFNSLWNDNNFFRAFLLLYTIFKERLNLKPKKKNFVSAYDLFIVTEQVAHYSSTLFSLFSHTVRLFLSKKFYDIKTNNYGTFNWPQPILMNMWCSAEQYFAFDTPLQKNLWEKYNLFF